MTFPLWLSIGMSVAALLINLMVLVLNSRWFKGPGDCPSPYIDKNKTWRFEDHGDWTEYTCLEDGQLIRFNSKTGEQQYSHKEST